MGVSWQDTNAVRFRNQYVDWWPIVEMAIGIAAATFTLSKPEITFTGLFPGIEFDLKKPTISFEETEHV